MFTAFPSKFQDVSLMYSNVFVGISRHFPHVYICFAGLSPCVPSFCSLVSIMFIHFPDFSLMFPPFSPICPSFLPISCHGLCHHSAAALIRVVPRRAMPCWLPQWLPGAEVPETKRHRALIEKVKWLWINTY